MNLHLHLWIYNTPELICATSAQKKPKALKHPIIMQHHYPKWKRKKHLGGKQMIPLLFLWTLWALWIYYCVCASKLCFPHASATVISHSHHKQENKAAITVVYDEACLWRTRQNCIRKKSAGNKDSLHTVHLPIKMQMRVGLQIRLSKQTEIKIRKKEKNKQNSSLCQEKKIM